MPRTPRCPRASRASVPAALAIALAAGTVTVVTGPASATPDGSQIVVSEVYGGGGNSGSVYSNDFVELYNPTSADVDVTGWRLEQRSANDGLGRAVTLSGVVPAGSHFLIAGKAGANPSAALPTPDQSADFDFGAKAAIAALFDASGAPVDLVGWGTAVRSETAPAPGTSNATSIQRDASGADTDNNAADFAPAAPNPGASSGSETPGDPEVPGETAVTPISEIQGTGAASPLVDTTVTAEGVVTAVYDEGGKNGFFLQTAGSGKQPGAASDAIFVYMGSRTDYPQRGASVRVTGTVGEYYNQTQIAAAGVTELDAPLETPVALEIDALPAGGEAREPYEGMLVRPTGAYTVTDNYSLNNTGDLGLAPGPLAHRTPTDVVAPGAEAQALAAKNDAEVVYLDDGRTRNYFRTDKSTPLPYLLTSDQGVKAIRTGDAVDFQTDVVVDYSFDRWRFQPLEPITGKNTAAELPITWEDSRAASLDVPAGVAGDYSIGFFNVLNYFTSLGEKEAGCKAFTDMNGAPVGTNGCTVRGAYSKEALADQQAKIVTAINRLDTDVLGLSEIENTATLTGDVARRDEALSSLVDALNAAAGEQRWAYVASPATLPGSEDVIRVAFIYNPATVTPVGESRIFDDGAYTGTARQPLAQAFEPTAGGDDFVAVVNHFKSKGSVALGDADTGDGQGNNANLRVEQAKALLTHLGEQSDWAQLPTFLVGDFNSYTREDSMAALEQGGFGIVHTEKDFDQASYQFGGELGSLDHVLANAAARGMVRDSAVWNINGDESAAFEYSRRNYNAHDFFGDGADPLYGYGNPFRSSDHDPVKVGFDLKKADNPGGPVTPGGSSGSSVSPLGILAALLAVIAGVVAAASSAFPGIAGALQGLLSRG
ncbi:ExeM/NucH family extracellular endonuclease [uncultured Corynebacterium sp.]|uniref:ExeM/NucH family extracellular endonuclease n=1 Tax=uncultured Corynebacterium sp. TaxID=159447 RepID=UPI0025991345|nr:ExeM/NucH family extracellular endonuclease [uncultured Corynebacterium sp.]